MFSAALHNCPLVMLFKESAFTVHEFTVSDVLGVLLNSFPLVAVLEGGQLDVEPQSNVPTRATQTPGQLPLSTGNTSVIKLEPVRCVCVVCVLCHRGVCVHMHLCDPPIFMCICKCACICMCVYVCMYLRMCAY